MTSLLSTVEAPDNLPYTYLIERLSDGRQFSFSKSGSTVDTLYESASTSKMISALIILRAVDNGSLSLTNRPQDLLTASPVWPITSGDPLYTMTLTHLLSLIAVASVESSLAAVQDKLVGTLLPLAAMCGLVFAGLSFVAGQPNARMHLIYAIFGAVLSGTAGMPAASYVAGKIGQGVAIKNPFFNQILS